MIPSRVWPIVDALLDIGVSIDALPIVLEALAPRIAEDWSLGFAEIRAPRFRPGDRVEGQFGGRGRVLTIHLRDDGWHAMVAWEREAPSSASEGNLSFARPAT